MKQQVICRIRLFYTFVSSISFIYYMSLYNTCQFFSFS